MVVSGKKWGKVVSSGMEMLIGEYSNTLDEKGRISFPSKLRSVLNQCELVVTQGLDQCLMLFTAEEWVSLTDKIMGSASVFDEQKLIVMRHFIAPAQRLEFDKSGRLAIPQSLREYAALKSGCECKIQGMIKFIELWDSSEYAKYKTDNAASLKDAASSMRNIIF